MRAPRHLWLIGLSVVLGALAQQDTPPPQSPEIRGVVLDPDTKQPVVSAEVSLYFIGAEQPRVMTGLGMMEVDKKAVTGFSGEFDFHLEKLGYYAVAAKKDGYNTPGSGGSNQRIIVTRDAPVQEARLYLARPGQITGIVTDEETRKPIAGVRVSARRPKVSGVQVFGILPAASATTGPDGAFVFRNVTSGEYVVEIGRQKNSQDRVVTKFTEEDLKTIDEDFERSVWPGGRGDDAAVPIIVGSGGSADVGVLRVRKVPYYRLHVKMPPSTCPPDGTMQVYEQVPGSMLSLATAASCKQDFLVTGFSPGSYQILLAVNSRDAATREMAAIPIVIVDKSIEITAPLQRGLTLEAHFVAADGSQPPDWTKATIALYPHDMLPFGELASPHKADAAGRIRLAGVPLGRHELTIGGIGAANYVKDVLYNGAQVDGSTLRLDSGAIQYSLTIVVDDKPAAITGSVTKGDQKVSKPFVLLTRWPMPSDEFLRPAVANADENGQFQFSGLAPGKYHLIALASQDDYYKRLPKAWQRDIASGQEVEVGPSASQSVTLELAAAR
jgi:hypothetical protein